MLGRAAVQDERLWGVCVRPFFRCGADSGIVAVPCVVFLRRVRTGEGSDGSSGYDAYYRFFSPWAGLDEDPVTGSAATVLGPYWSGVLGRSELALHQASARGGDLLVSVGEQRVMVSGQAVVLIQGTMTLARSG